MRVFPRQHNFTGGFDGKFKLNPQTTTQFQVVATHSRRNFYDPFLDSAPYRTGNGFGYYFNLDYTEKNRGFFIEASGRTRFYRADAGFTRRTNTNSFFVAGRLSTEPQPKAKIIRLSWQPFARINYDWQGRSQNALLGSGFNFDLQHNTYIHFETGIGYERLFEEEFGAKRTATQTGAFFGAPERSAYQPYFSLNASRTINKQLSIGGDFNFSRNQFDLDFGGGNRYPRVSPAYFAYLGSPDYLNYSNLRTLNSYNPLNFPPAAPPLDPGRGRQIDADIEIEYKPIDPLRVSLEYTKSKLTRYDTRRTTYDDNIVSLRSTYQFTRFIFARTRVDYDSLSSNVSGQLLFGWNPNPGTAVYAGYNDNFNYNGFNPYTEQYEPGISRNGRTFFIRLSYLFRKSF